MSGRTLVLAGAAFVAALAISPLAHAGSADAAAARAAIESAGQMQAKAFAMDGAWSTTAAVLKQARDSVAKQDYAQAVTEAKRANRLARLSIAQATAQKKLWREAVAR